MNKSKKSINVKYWLFFILSYILSQIIVYFYSKSNFFTTPMYIFLPIIGFITLNYITPKLKDYLNINILTILISFIALSLISFYVVLFFWKANMYVLQGMFGTLPFFSTLISSAYIVFVISGVFGIVEKMDLF